MLSLHVLLPAGAAQYFHQPPARKVSRGQGKVITWLKAAVVFCSFFPSELILAPMHRAVQCGSVSHVARPPCPSASPAACSNSCPLSRRGRPAKLRNLFRPTKELCPHVTTRQPGVLPAPRDLHCLLISPLAFGALRARPRLSVLSLCVCLQEGDAGGRTCRTSDIRQ